MLIGRRGRLHVAEPEIVLVFDGKPSPLTSADLKSRCGFSRRNNTESREWYARYSHDRLRSICEYLGHSIDKVPIAIVEQFLSSPPSVAENRIYLQDAQGNTYLFAWYVDGDGLVVKDLGLDPRIDCLNTVYFWGRMYQVYRIEQWEEHGGT